MVITYLTQYKAKASFAQLEVSRRDLIFEHEFRKKPDRYGRLRWVWSPIGMPRLTHQMMSCVFFLFGENIDGTPQTTPNGTGFFIGWHSRDLPYLHHLYAVSNRHTVTESPIIRVNTKKGGTRLIEYNPDQWVFSDTDDLAIIDVTDDLIIDYENPANSDDISWVHELDLLNHYEGGGRAYVGDQTIMLGLFYDHMGAGKINLPVARFENLAAFAHDDVPVRAGNNDPFARPAFLNDTKSRSGFSGSPVWAWYNPDNDVDPWERSKSPMSSLLSTAKRPTDLCLIGIHRGQFREVSRVISSAAGAKVKEDDTIEVNSSMTIVVPAWEIKNLIEGSPKFQIQRKMRDEREDRKDLSASFQKIAKAQERIIPPPPYR